MLKPRYTISPTPNLLIIWAFITAFLVVLQFYITIPLTESIVKQFGVTAAQAAFGMTGFGFSYATGLLIFGTLSDYYGRPRVILCGLLLLSATTFAVAQSSSYASYISLRVVQGFTAAMIPSVILALHSEYLPPLLRTRGIALTSFAFLTSAPAVQVWLSNPDATLHGAMQMLWPLYILAALLLPLFRLLPGGSRSKKQLNAALAKPTTTHIKKPNQFIVLLRKPIIVCCWLTACTVLFSYAMFHAGFPIFWRDHPSVLSSIKIAALTPLPLTIIAGFIIPKLGPSKVSILGLSTGALGLLLGAVSQSPAAVIATSALLSAGIATAVPGLIALTSYHSAPENRGLAISTYSFILFISASLAPPIAHYLSTVSYQLWLFVPACTLATAAALTLFGSTRTQTS